MFKLMCFMSPAVIAVCIKHYFIQNNERILSIIREWLFCFIIINLFTIITALPFGSVIIAECEKHRFHIQYGLIAVTMSNVYSIILGIFYSFITMNREIRRGSNEDLE